ncbi:MAG: hypothetical protein E7183_06570 [Erysipelotrichaceae bacterium]|nr:hypothetical protein [Erysipelotrichaceae bacterium]
MNWIVHNYWVGIELLIISIIVFSFTIVILLIGKNKQNNSRTVIALNIGIFLSLFIINCSKFIILNVDEYAIDYNFAEILLMLVNNMLLTIQYFFASVDYRELFISSVYFKQEFFYYLFNTSILVYSIAAIIGGASVLFNFIKDFFPKFFLQFNSKKKRYLFSALNNSSLEIAKKISLKSDESRFIVFFNCKDVDSNLLYKAKKIGAICLFDDINNVTLNCNKNFIKFSIFIKKFFCKKVIDSSLETVYWLIDYDENINNKDAINLICNLKQKKLFVKMDKINIFIYCTSKINEVEICQYYNNRIELSKNENDTSISQEEKMILKKISFTATNDIRNLIYNLMFDDSTALYNYIDKKKDDKGHIINSKLSVLILGSGLIGKEFFKAACWCGQIGDYIYNKELNKDKFKMIDLKISVVSNEKEPTASDKFKSEMFGLFNEKYGKKLVNVDFETLDFGTLEYDNKINEIILKDKPKYIVVAFGNDELNYKAATHLGKSFLQNNLSNENVLINYFIEDTEYYNIINTLNKNESIKELKHSNIKLNCISNMESAEKNYCFEEDHSFFFDKQLLELAYSIHLAYEKSDINHRGDFSTKAEFLASPSSLYSSIASVIHAKYKMFALGKHEEFDEFYYNYENKNIKYDFQKSVNNNIREWILMEHNKWSAFNYCEGLVTAKNYHIINYIMKMETNNNERPSKYKEAGIHMNLVENKLDSINLYNIIKCINDVFVFHNQNTMDITKKLNYLINEKPDMLFCEWVNEVLTNDGFTFIVNEDLTIEECIEKHVISINLINSLDDLDKTNIVYEYLYGCFDFNAITKIKEKDKDFAVIGEYENGKKLQTESN